jgi:hypothetical protein
MQGRLRRIAVEEPAVQHEQQDAPAAHRRAQDGYQPHWHPLLAAVEVSPGEWHMVSPSGERYAVIRALEIGGERGYRVVTGEAGTRTLVGYFRTLRAATMRAHRRWLDGHARAGGVNGG